MLIKLGEATVITESDIQSTDSITSDPAISARFEKIAAELKSIAPKAKDFLYFSAVMMHAAEAALLNDGGGFRVGADGKPISASWVKNGESWKWECSDSNVRPYKNTNNDIFPEEELLKAYKKWVGRPLCLDHKSNSVDMIRGVIVDTYYDAPRKRVVALCALDKINYPDLARKVSTGYATSVSMGTAVGKAICSDCGNVARVEADFCDHMKNKSCYGEINIDLAPIELSIVVNGADPQAKIKHIMAAADTISQYLEVKEHQIQDLTKKGLDTQDIASIKKDLENIQEKLAKLEESAKDSNSVSDTAPYGMTNSTYDQKEAEISGEQSIQTPGEARWTVGEAEKATLEIYSRLDAMNKTLEKLSAMTTNKDDKMANEFKKESYFQGGGDANEPSPGQPKYEKEDYQSIRDGKDKQMVGQGPFPDTGPVDGMHPGYDSFGESEEARKRRLQRLATAEERKLQRQAALKKAKAMLESKKAYHQGGGELNDPEKLPYPEMGDHQNIRDKEDKQMVGQPPFPGVGKVDGLHPSPASADQKDELKRKQLLQRASLKAKFVKAANEDGSENLHGSRWDVYAGDKLILTATVGEISGNRVEALYDSIATRDFGLKLIEKIKSDGFDKVASMLKPTEKKAQVSAPAAPGGAPAAPPDAQPPAEMPADLGAEPLPPMGEEADLGPLDEAEETGGDPASSAASIADDIADRVSDLKEALKALSGEAEEMASDEELLEGSAPEAPAPAPVTASVAGLQNMRKKLNAALRGGLKQAIAELTDHHEELRLVNHIYKKAGAVNKSNHAYVKGLTSEALADAKRTLADSLKLMSAFVKYARGTEALEKRAAVEAKRLAKTAQVLPDNKPEPVGESYPEGRRPGYLEGKDLPKQNLLNSKPKPAEEEAAEEDLNEVVTLSDDAAKKMIEKGLEMTASKTNLMTKEARAAYRAKLAQTGLKFSDMLDAAHPKGGFTTQLDTKPTGDLAHVEDLPEQHAKFMDVASAPPKVRKAAEDIQKLISTGKLEAANVDELVAFGVDADAVKYWKQFYGQAPDGGSEFAAALVKEHAKAQQDEQMQTYRVKVASAYELAHNMVARGMLDDNRTSVSEQVDEIMTWNDEAFESMRRVVARQAPIQKQASALPQVGMIGSGDVIVPGPAAEGDDLASQLSAAFAHRRY